VSESELRPENLLAGPRGRELCARLAGIDVRELREQFVPLRASARLLPVPDRARRTPPVEAELPGQDDDEPPQPFPPDRDDPLAVIPALADVTEDAGYWGGYPARDPLDDPALIARLRPVAARLAGSAGCRWWWSGLDRAAQQYVQWTARQSAPELGYAAEMLRDADAEADEDERRMSRERHRAAGSGVNGPWWTRPGVISTTRRLGRLGAVLLAGQEDSFGDTDAVVWPLTVAGTARVLEIDGPQAWQRLIAVYPRTATATYRHTWAWTGWDGEWVVPRWPAVARDWDGVHLSVAGYLATAGRALPAGTGRTLLGGWNPDETYWLTDVLTPGGPARAWHNHDRTPLGWQEHETTA
jgi:hypothetical protein